MLAENNDSALLLARSNQFDLYMIDNWMPGGSGIDLCRKLREFDSHTPILFYSGAAHDKDKQEAFSSGAQGYLTKPVDNDELIEAVSQLIAEGRMEIRSPN
jgi:DNA-binding response OmpR family regulator